MSAPEWIDGRLRASARDGSASSHYLRTALGFTAEAKVEAPVSAPRRALRRLKGAVEANLQDARLFGPGFLLRHVSAFSTGPMIRIRAGRHGAFHVRRNREDVSALRRAFGEGAYDFSGHAMLSDRLERRYRAILGTGRRPVLIDAGAGIGAATVALAESWPLATVVAMEPDADKLVALRLNLAGLGDCTMTRAVLGPDPAQVSVRGRAGDAAVCASRMPIGVVLAVAGVTQGSAEPFLCKLSVDAFDADLFAGEPGWMDAFEMIVIEPRSSVEPGERLMRMVQRAAAQRGFTLIEGEHAVLCLRG